MGRMTIETIKSLYQYGKKLYLKEIDLKEAVNKVHSSHPEVAESSARHYINWYSKMREGDYLTWNTNSSLLMYYAEHIIIDDGIEAGKIAIKAAKGFAKNAGRTDLERDLCNLEAKYQINNERLESSTLGKLLTKLQRLNIVINLFLNIMAQESLKAFAGILMRKVWDWEKIEP